MPYVELHRSFIDYTEVEDQENAVEESLIWHFPDEELSWPELLTSRFVVVLGEAGTGKTTEFEDLKAA